MQHNPLVSSVHYAVLSQSDTTYPAVDALTYALHVLSHARLGEGVTLEVRVSHATCIGRPRASPPSPQQSVMIASPMNRDSLIEFLIKYGIDDEETVDILSFVVDTVLPSEFFTSAPRLFFDPHLAPIDVNFRSGSLLGRMGLYFEVHCVDAEKNREVLASVHSISAQRLILSLSLSFGKRCAVSYLRKVNEGKYAAVLGMYLYTRYRADKTVSASLGMHIAITVFLLPFIPPLVVAVCVMVLYAWLPIVLIGIGLGPFFWCLRYTSKRRQCTWCNRIS